MKHIFLFVNPSSGGNRASMFTELGINEIIFHKPQKCHLYIYNILDSEKGKKPGFQKLQLVLENLSQIEVVKEDENFQNDKEIRSTNNEKVFIDGDEHVIHVIDNTNGNNHCECIGKETGSNEKKSLYVCNHLENSIVHPEQEKAGNVPSISGTKGSVLSMNGVGSSINSMNGQQGSVPSCVNGVIGSVEKNETCEEKAIVNAKKTERENEDLVYILVAGGDGTVNWVLKETEFYEIDSEKIAVGVIPFGTGNDFAKAFGWKKIDALFNHLFLINCLRKIVEQLFKAKLEKHDYWNIQIRLKEKGFFNKINSKTKKKENLEEDDGVVKQLNFCMSNYFSIGIDSRIGRGFERRRKKNAFCNKLVYAMEGFKKITFKKNIPLNEMIAKMVEGKNGERTIFTTNSNEKYPLLKNAMTIVCINIPSYSSGNDIWNYTHKIGLKLPKNLSAQDKQMYDELKKANQQLGDEKLEFVTYQSGIDLGLEFTIKGRAYRVHQGMGPWKIYFKDHTHNVYFQVDGEFFLMANPDHICIEHYKKINVLKNII